MTSVPNGDKGVQLKLKVPSRCTLAERRRFNWEEWSRLRVVVACGRMRSQRCMGKCLSVVQRHATKWFLKVWMARSTALRQCMCGGTSWKSMPL
jgi:hypothetical protein